jgi:hypothetical protein
MIAKLRAASELIGRFMGRLWLTVLYFTVVLPFGIIARLRAKNQPRAEVAWTSREQRAADLAEARKQS